MDPEATKQVCPVQWGSSMGKITALPAVGGGGPILQAAGCSLPSLLASLVITCSKLVLPQDGVAVASVKQVLGSRLWKSQPVFCTLLWCCCSG